MLAMLFINLGLPTAKLEWHILSKVMCAPFSIYHAPVDIYFPKNGIPFANAVANVAFNGEKVVSYGSSFVDTGSGMSPHLTRNVQLPKGHVFLVKIAASEPTVSWKSVLSDIEETMDATYNGHNATLEYLVQSDGSIALTHVIQVQNEETSAWYETFIDAHSGKILSVSDFVADASVRSCPLFHGFEVFTDVCIKYTVVPTTKQSLADGLETLVDPQDPIASPFGWHNAGFGNATTTSYVVDIPFHDTLLLCTVETMLFRLMARS